MHIAIADISVRFVRSICSIAHVAGLPEVGPYMHVGSPVSLTQSDTIRFIYLIQTLGKMSDMHASSTVCRILFI